MRIIALFLFVILSFSFANIGNIVLLKGKVDIIRNNAVIMAKNGASIEKYDTIKSYKDGRAQIKFKDNTIITIGNSTTLKVKDYLFDTKKPKAKFSFLRGTFKSITGKIGKIAPQNFKLRTKTATIGIRGTIVLGQITPKGDTIACLQGVIAVKNINMPQAVVVPAGKFTSVLPGKPPLPPAKLTTETIKKMSAPLKVKKEKKEDKEAKKETTKEKKDEKKTKEKQKTKEKKDKEQKKTTNEKQTTKQKQTTNQKQTTQEKQTTVVEQKTQKQTVAQNTINNAQTTPPPTIIANTNDQTPQIDNQPLVQIEPLTVTAPVQVAAVSEAVNNNIKDAIDQAVITSSAEQLGVEPESVVDQIQNQECPVGTEGVYPDCKPMKCPENTEGVYPNCTPKVCPEGTTGTYPDCGVCGENEEGVYPNCTPKVCPEGTTGTYPDCGVCGENEEGVYPNCTPKVCPEGTTGTYPDCSPLACPEGTTGTYPDCTPIVTTTDNTQTETITNDGRNVALYGIANQSFDDLGEEFAYNYATTYTLVDNTLSGSNTISYYDTFGSFEGNKTISWSMNLPLPEATSSYQGWNQVENSMPITLTSYDGNTTYLSGYATTYYDTKQEFFINKLRGTDSASGKSLTYTETAGVYADLPDFSDDNFLYKDKVVYYANPVDTTDVVGINYKNQNVFTIYFDEDSFFVYTGRVVDENGKSKIVGNVFDASYDWNTASFSTLANGHTGHIYGSEYQGIDIFGRRNDTIDHYNSDGFAGYATSVYPVDISSVGDMQLYGYGVATDINGITNVPTGVNFDYLIDRDGGYTISGSIDDGSIGSVNFTEDSSSNIKTFYLDDDYFATFSMTDLGWLLAMPDYIPYDKNQLLPYKNYISWGYYSYQNGSDPVVPSPWVAGSYVDNAYNAIRSALAYSDVVDLSYKYNGKILGEVLDDGVRYPIDGATSDVELDFNFGAGFYSLSSDSYMNFSANGYDWNITFESNGLFTGSTYEASIDGSNSSYTKNSDANLSGSIQGLFYGPTAESTGGAFGIDTDVNASAYGVFATTRYDNTASDIAFSSAPPSWTVSLDDNSTDVGVVSLNGWASYTDSNNNFTVSTIYLDINSSEDSISSSSNIAPNISLAKDANSSTMTFLDINNFSIQNFNSAEGWLQSDNNVSYDYVAYGYWETNVTKSLTPNGNYWVAGVDSFSASSYIESLATDFNAPHTTYVYDGHVIGDVKTYKNSTSDIVYMAEIDPQENNDVHLNFNFGGGQAALLSGSYIKFQTSEYMPELWQIWLNGTSAAVFNYTNTDNVNVNGKNYNTELDHSASSIMGYFYGPEAQNVGGEFGASIYDNSTATNKVAEGVFKAENTQKIKYLTGIANQSFEDSFGYDYAVDDHSSFTFTQQNFSLDATFTGNNTIRFYNSNGNYLGDKNISWTTSVPYNPSSTYNEWHYVENSIPITLTSYDGSTVYLDGNMTTYYGDKYEFFINKIYGTDPDNNQSISYTETAGLLSPTPLDPDYFIYKDMIVAYVDPSSNDFLVTSFKNQNIMYLSQDVDDGGVDMFMGRVVDDNGNYALIGNSFSALGDFSQFSYSLDNNFSGHFYGSQYQGMDISGLSINEQNLTKSDSFAGFLPGSYDIASFNDEMSATVGVGDLSLSGYALAFTKDGSYDIPNAKNFSYSMSRDTGYTINGSIDNGSVGSVAFLADDSDDIKSAYINDDTFATVSLSDNGWLFSMPDYIPDSGDYTLSAQNYVTWGYYSYINGDNPVISSPWVAGTYVENASNTINNVLNGNLTSDLEYCYSGKVLGAVNENGTSYAIDDTSSAVDLYFDFGAGSLSLRGSIYFQANSNDWNIYLANLSLENGSFTAGIDTANSSYSADSDANLSGIVLGTFYGPNAESIGGVFGIDTDVNASAAGVFTSTRYDYDSDIGYSSTPDSWSVPLSDDSNDAELTLSGYYVTAFSSYGYGLGSDLTLDINATDDSLGASSGIPSIGVSFAKDANSSTMTFLDINNFSIQDFNTSSGWIQSDTTQSDEYVSWGYWETNDSTVLSTKGNLWVAGYYQSDADSYIVGLIESDSITSYTYNGKVLGVVKSQEYSNSDDFSTLEIDPVTNNEVVLNFDFGGGKLSLKSGSYIKFQTKAATPESWQINVSGEILGAQSSSYSIDNTQNVIVNGKTYEDGRGSEIEGRFYGPNAESTAGNFIANIQDGHISKTAEGVFKASR